MTVTQAEIDEVVAESKRVLLGNHHSGISAWDGKRYECTYPSPTSYPFQWFWDSAFIAIALLHVDPELAKREISCLLQGVQPDGFMPHMLLWEKSSYLHWLEDEYSIRLAHPFYTGTTQPPVVARAIERIYDATKDVAFLRETLEPTLRIFRWLKAVRDPDDDGLVCVIQPDETGLDASPKYDLAMGISHERPEEVLPQLTRSMHRLFKAYEGIGLQREPLLDVFNFEDVMFNAIYADGLRALARLCRIAGFPEGEAYECEQRYRRVRDALVAKCWDEEAAAFWDLSGLRSETPQKVLTFSIFFPIILPDLDRKIVRALVERHLLNEKEFWLPYPIPTVAATEPSFDPAWKTNTTWRGPTWVNVNWYLYWGLRQHGFEDVAEELRSRTISMIASGGVREFFDPRTAAGEGAKDFAWTCLAADLAAAPQRSPASTSV